jgi:predicted AlkP superfamily phosphohydrolase/phosphomutase
VDEGDVAAIKRDLTEMFASTNGEGGQKIVRRVFDGDEVYRGPHAAQGPDLLLIPENGYDMKGKLGAPAIVGERRLQGMHTWDNAFFFATRNDLTDLPDNLEIVDVPWIILRSIDVGA